jgi:hypothetical protein
MQYVCPHSFALSLSGSARCLLKQPAPRLRCRNGSMFQTRCCRRSAGEGRWCSEFSAANCKLFEFCADQGRMAIRLSRATSVAWRLVLVLENIAPSCAPIVARLTRRILAISLGVLPCAR